MIEVARRNGPILFAIVLASVVALQTESASACNCLLRIPPSPCVEASGSDTIVFVGTVLTEESITLPTNLPDFPKERGRKRDSSVQETWSGHPSIRLHPDFEI